MAIFTVLAQSPLPNHRHLVDAFDYLDAPVERIASSDVPMPYARNLEDHAMVHPEQIVSSVNRLLNIKF
jgi:pyruvate dehydrogenase E1 component beta subunit